MKTRTTSRAARTLLRADLVAGAVLAFGSASCSGDDDDARRAMQPSMSVPGESPGEEMSASQSPSGGNTSAMETGAGTAAGEGQQVTDIDMSGGEPGSGEMTGDDPGSDSTQPEGPAGAVPSGGCGHMRTLQDGNQTIVSGGVSRTYFLQTPSDYDSAHPHRVVFMFHWNYGSINAIVNPPDADRNTDRPFYGLGDLTDGKTIFVVPQGLISPTGGAGWENPDSRDVLFTDDLLAAISSDLCIDSSRVFTTGFSYGAGMSLALACTRPDKFRAALVYAAAFISGTQPAECTTPIALFEAHGVDDPIINYQTGLNVLNVFSGLNGCTATTPPSPPQDGHTCVSLDGCSHPTRFCTFGAGQGNPFNTSLRGHYPTAKDPGQNTSWIPAEAWSFITQF